MLIQELYNLLDLPDSDYWFDSGCEIARNLINENRDEIFILLKSVWREWPAVVQEHLVYILGEGSSERELELIEDMVSSKYESVVYRSKEALIDFNKKT